MPVLSLCDPEWIYFVSFQGRLIKNKYLGNSWAGCWESCRNSNRITQWCCSLPRWCRKLQGKAWCSSSAAVPSESQVQKLLFVFLFLVPGFVISGSVTRISPSINLIGRIFIQIPFIEEQLRFLREVFVDAHFFDLYLFWRHPSSTVRMSLCFLLKTELIYWFSIFY